MESEISQEIWQVDANGKIFETNFSEMTEWINDGSLLREDKVRKGNLRWIEAGKVPPLVTIFNAKDNGQPLTPPIVTTTNVNPSLPASEASANPPNLSPMPANSTVPNVGKATTPSVEPICSIHADVPASYLCDTCSNQFCKACPKSYGSTVKICPLCGAMCRSLVEIAKVRTETAVYSSAVREGFGLGDFAKSLAYPLRFKTSLIAGAIMFMFFSIGQSAVGFGGIFMLGAAIICFMLANMLTFGILANTVDNFSQGKTDANFMPSFDEFALWDDVVHPFFLSIGVYLSSFGPFLVVMVVAIFLVAGAVKPAMNGVQSDAARMVNPELPYAANAARQSERVREILKKDADEQKRRVEAMESGEVPTNELPNREAVKDAEQFNADNMEEMNQLIQQQRKAQLEAAVGKTPETVAKERSALISKIFGFGLVFIVIGGITLLWGIFYFPAACAVAGYTRSFRATLNPTVGLDTIRRLGSDYVKVLLMWVAIAIMSGVVAGALSTILSPFDMPGVGNIPAKAIGSLFGFYFSVVFSCMIGFALFKAADRLDLYR